VTYKKKSDIQKEINALLEKQRIFENRSILPTSTRSADDGGAFLGHPDLEMKTQSVPLPNIEVKRISESPLRPKGDIPPPPLVDPYNPTPGASSPRPFGDGVTPYGPDEDEWMIKSDTTKVEPALSPDSMLSDSETEMEMPSGTILSPQQNFLMRTPGGPDMDNDDEADKGLYSEDFVEPPEELDIGVYDKLKKAKLNRIESLGIDVDALPDLPCFSNEFSEGPKGVNHKRMVSEGPKNQRILSKEGPINQRMLSEGPIHRMLSEGPIHVQKKLSKDPNIKVVQQRKFPIYVGTPQQYREIDRDHSLLSNVPSLPRTPTTTSNDAVSPFPDSAYY